MFIKTAIFVAYLSSLAASSVVPRIDPRDFLSRGICGNSYVQIFDSRERRAPPEELYYAIAQVGGDASKKQLLDAYVVAMGAVSKLQWIENFFSEIVGGDNDNCLQSFKVTTKHPNGDSFSKTFTAADLANIHPVMYPNPTTPETIKGNAIWAYVIFETIYASTLAPVDPETEQPNAISSYSEMLPILTGKPNAPVQDYLGALKRCDSIPVVFTMELDGKTGPYACQGYANERISFISAETPSVVQFIYETVFPVDKMSYVITTADSI